MYTRAHVHFFFVENNLACTRALVYAITYISSYIMRSSSSRVQIIWHVYVYIRMYIIIMRVEYNRFDPVLFFCEYERCANARGSERLYRLSPTCIMYLICIIHVYYYMFCESGGTEKDDGTSFIVAIYTQVFSQSHRVEKVNLLYIFFVIVRFIVA